MRSRTRALPLPRYIRPENLEIGDRIRVTYIIANREYAGRLRTLSTREGAVLVAYGPEPVTYKVSLLGRREVPQTQLEGVEW